MSLRRLIFWIVVLMVALFAGLAIVQLIQNALS